MRATRPSDHDSRSASSHGNTAKSSTSVGTERRAAAMASWSGSPFTSNSNNHSIPESKCCVAGCSATALWPLTNICSLHVREGDERRARAKASEEDPSKGAAGIPGPGQKTMRSRLPLDHGPNSIIPVARRKTGSTGGVIGPESFYAKTSGSTTALSTTTPAQKRTQEARSPPDNLGGTGPARKKPRLETAVSSAAVKADVPVKKPWDTGFNPRPATKPPERMLSRPGKTPETGGSNKARLPTHRTQRKFAPRIELSSKAPSLTPNEPDSPHLNGSAPRATSQSTASPSSQGKEFVANDSLRAWYQRSRDASSDNKSSFLRARASFDQPTSARSPTSFVDERRATREAYAGSAKGLSSHYFHSSQTPKPALSKLPSIPREHLEGWKFVPPPTPKPQPAQTASLLDFDSLIYAQEGAAPPPLGVSVRRKQKPQPAPKPEPTDEPFFMHMDPRQHWPQPQREQWYQDKLKEIEARGGRKANFGKAAQRMKERRLKEPRPKSFEEGLPERIRANPALVRALKQMHEEELAVLQDRKPGRRVAQGRTKPGRQGPRRQASTAGPTTPRKG